VGAHLVALLTPHLAVFLVSLFTPVFSAFFLSFVLFPAHLVFVMFFGAGEGSAADRQAQRQGEEIDGAFHGRGSFRKWDAMLGGDILTASPRSRKKTRREPLAHRRVSSAIGLVVS